MTTPSTFRCSLISQSVTVLGFPRDFFSIPPVQNDLPFCRTQFTATFRSDGPCPEAGELSRDDDDAFDFPLPRWFRNRSLSLDFPVIFFLSLQFQTTYRSAGPSSPLRSVLTDRAPKQVSWVETTTTPSTFRCSLISQSVTVLGFPRDVFSIPPVQNDLPFCRTQFNATFRSDGPCPEAGELSRDDDDAFDFPLPRWFRNRSLSLDFPVIFFLSLQFQTTYRSAGPSSPLRSVLTEEKLNFFFLNSMLIYNLSDSDSFNVLEIDLVFRSLGTMLSNEIAKI